MTNSSLSTILACIISFSSSQIAEADIIPVNVTQHGRIDIGSDTFSHTHHSIGIFTTQFNLPEAGGGVRTAAGANFATTDSVWLTLEADIFGGTTPTSPPIDFTTNILLDFQLFEPRTFTFERVDLGAPPSPQAFKLYTLNSGLVPTGEIDLFGANKLLGPDIYRFELLPGVQQIQGSGQQRGTIGQLVLTSVPEPNCLTFLLGLVFGVSRRRFRQYV